MYVQTTGEPPREGESREEDRGVHSCAELLASLQPSRLCLLFFSATRRNHSMSSWTVRETLEAPTPKRKENTLALQLLCVSLGVPPSPKCFPQQVEKRRFSSSAVLPPRSRVRLPKSTRPGPDIQPVDTYKDPQDTKSGITYQRHPDVSALASLRFPLRLSLVKSPVPP